MGGVLARYPKVKSLLMKMLAPVDKGASIEELLRIIANAKSNGKDYNTVLETNYKFEFGRDTLEKCSEFEVSVFWVKYIFYENYKACRNILGVVVLFGFKLWWDLRN